jgi:hypothetical protein
MLALALLANVSPGVRLATTRTRARCVRKVSAASMQPLSRARDLSELCDRETSGTIKRGGPSIVPPCKPRLIEARALIGVRACLERQHRST